MGRSLEGHGAADVDVGGLDVGLRIPQEGEQVEGRIVEPVRRHFQRAGEEVLAQGPAVEHELDVEGRFQALLHRLDLLVGKALGPQGAGVDGGSLAHGAVAHRIGLDLGDLGFAVAEGAKRIGHRPVDDLPVAAARELLELHQGEVGLDAGGVAIHHQADGAGGRDDRGLGVAVAVALAELQGPVPGLLGMGHQGLIRAGGVVEGDRVDGQALIAPALSMGRAAMVADHPQHVPGVGLVVRERPELARHLGGGGVGHAGHDGGDRAAQRPARVGIVRKAHGHEQAADIGVAEASVRYS
jgi:hypothetical protein